MSVKRGVKGAAVVYLFFRECCFRVRVGVNPNPNPKTAFVKKKLNPETAFFEKKTDLGPGPDPDPDPTFY